MGTLRNRRMIMSRSCYYTFTAPPTVTAQELEAFLNGVGVEAKAMGYQRTRVRNEVINTLEQRERARWIVRGLQVEDARLKHEIRLDEQQVWEFSPERGYCRVAPERAVLLELTDEEGYETRYGFAWYPAVLRDLQRQRLVKVPEGGQWFWRDYVQAPDPRFWKILRQFQEAGYLRERKC
jgi:hypothetical protein